MLDLQISEVLISLVRDARVVNERTEIALADFRDA
jgi:hypothetical protein